MLSKKDEIQIKQRGSELHVVLQQVENFKKGFSYLEVIDAATVGNGIIRPGEKEIEEHIERFNERTRNGLIPLKFIPASGAASRMFNALFEALDVCMKASDPDEALAQNAVARQFLINKEKFAFYHDLEAAANSKNREKTCSTWIECLLTEKGLNYGALPKGLLKFHHYPDRDRTPFEEHLVEGAHYAKDKTNTIRLHFTVSPEHLSRFEALLSDIKNPFEKKYDVTLDVSFSVQKPATDTIAVDPENEPFREPDGSLLFRWRHPVDDPT